MTPQPFLTYFRSGRTSFGMIFLCPLLFPRFSWGPVRTGRDVYEVSGLLYVLRDTVLFPEPFVGPIVSLPTRGRSSTFWVWGRTRLDGTGGHRAPGGTGPGGGSVESRSGVRGRVGVVAHSPRVLLRYQMSLPGRPSSHTPRPSPSTETDLSPYPCRSGSVHRPNGKRVKEQGTVKDPTPEVPPGRRSGGRRRGGVCSGPVFRGRGLRRADTTVGEP